MKIKRIALLSILTGIALIMFMVESMFPPLLLPGAKMGLSNLITLFTLAVLGPIHALLLITVRTVLGSFFAANPSTLMYSLPAGLISVLVSAVMMRLFFPRVSLVAISVTSAVMHNLTQNLVYCLITQTPQMFAYMPYLALIGVLAGIITGYAVHIILRILPESLFRQVMTI